MSVKMKITVTKEILEKSSMCSMVEEEGKVVRISKSKLGPSYYMAEDGNNVVTNCAIAVAVREIFPDACVGLYRIKPFCYKDKNTPGYKTMAKSGHFMDDLALDISLPIEAMEFIRAFDDAQTPEERKDMPELEFEVIIPDIVIDELPMPDLREYLKESKTLQLV